MVVKGDRGDAASSDERRFSGIIYDFARHGLAWAMFDGVVSQRE